MRHRRLALLLVVLGVLLLPTPFYLSWAAEATAPPPKTPNAYVAEQLDPGNATDRQTLLHRHRSAVAVPVDRVSNGYVEGATESPQVTARTLETAMESGSGTTDDPGARADLRAIDRNYTFVYDDMTQPIRYYRLSVTAQGAEVRATNVSRATVVEVLVDRGAHDYDALSPGAQETVDTIIEKASGDAFGYRPRVTEPFVDRLPALVRKDGTLYSLAVGGHVDDLGPGFAAFFMGLVGTGVGLLLTVAGGVLGAVVWWRDDEG